MRRALKDRLVAYKVPQELKVVDEIPKNAMGKSKWLPFGAWGPFDTDTLIVNKKALVKEVFGPDA